MVNSVKQTQLSEETEGSSAMVTAMGVEDTGVNNLKKSKYHCEQCDVPFTNLTEFNGHTVNLHKGSPKYVCFYCKAFCTGAQSLTEHISLCNLNYVYTQCPVCWVYCRRRSYLLKHIQRKHTMGIEYFQTQSWKIQCGIIKRKVASQIRSQKRSQIRPQIRSRLKCSQCDSFILKHNLTLHLRTVHESEKLQCPECLKIFKRKPDLEYHVHDIHKKTFMNGKLVNSSDILSDENGASILKRLKCPQCDRTYVHKRDLDHHINDVHLSQKYKCPECLKVFKRYPNLLYHLSEVHKMTLVNEKSSDNLANA